jgi:hypothetical protein
MAHSGEMDPRLLERIWKRGIWKRKLEKGTYILFMQITTLTGIKLHKKHLFPSLFFPSPPFGGKANPAQPGRDLPA